MTRTLHEPWPKPKRPPSAGDPPSQSAAPQKTAESISRKPYENWWVGPLHDFHVDLIADALQPLLEFGSLIAAVGIQLQKEWIQAEQRAHQHHASVAVLDVGGMHDGAQQQTLRVDQDMALLAVDFLAGVVARRRSPTDRCGPPLFRALDALTVDDRGGRAGLSLGQLPTLDVKRVMDAIQRAVGVPAAEVVVHRAAGRQVLRQRCPRAAGAQDIHKPVDNLPLDNSTLMATALGGRNQRGNDRPLGIRQVAGVAQLAPVIPGAVLVRPHRAAPATRTATMES